MVLQDIGDPPQDNSDDSYSQYASPSGRRFDSSQLPRPIPLIAPLVGSSETVVRIKTEQTIKFAEQKVHRSLTQPEAQALAFHLYQLEKNKSYFAVAGVAAGSYRWYTTMADFRYPFYKPKPESIDPNKFLFIRGPNAQYARQAWRFAAFAFVAGQIGKLLGVVLAQPLAAQATAADPALAQFSTDLKAALSIDHQKDRDFASHRKAEWEERIRRNAGASAPARKVESNTNSQYGDDMSPTSGDDAWGTTSGSDHYSDSGFSSSSTSQATTSNQQAARPQPTNSWSRQRNRRDHDDDDASPTGGLFQDEVQDQSRPGESAWDRLRRGAGPAAEPRPKRPEPTRREQREGSSLGGSFTFAETDDERRYAQEKAQREFDQRIEQERQGKSFDEERRW
ncbi:hypothetical protein BU24DRAFT_418132 [Aaosphaeria arxii CBS 175.79]|uniref:Uncharacterized protein n=1 Tax=Aaosphaeria arxii CBS 175.79 TaxID=1450172 RepID=A0A6A5Y228_9PLEO|nr:uncharacterized protein BU24DRAFT_418132 [Aaosphaeria arxii CBS 175.79]KAF2018614.1 hypothetical protein BU24DRAFT_418132 [Aaosphaeria arxii CBS 175.79]